MEVRNRFKGLHLIDRVPDDLWTEVCDIVQETGIKTILMEKKCKKAKWLSGETLQIAVKRREVKSKGKKDQGLVPLRWGCALPSPNAPGKAPNHIHTTLRWGRAPGKPSR